MIKKQKLTSWEWEGLVSEYNLADGHAHQSQSVAQRRVIENLSNLFDNAESKSQEIIQLEFENEFFSKAGQLSYKKLLPPQYHYACSISIEVVANYLRMNNKSLSLIHPAFDNLADIFKRHKIDLFSVEEEDLLSINKLNKISTDCLMIICPNNPTGQELSRKQFKNIVAVCKQKNITLIIDFSFRFYSSFKDWDQYKLLDKSGIDFIILEDTGKTFPTLDLKLGILLASKSLYYDLQNITNDFLLNVSPFVFEILTQYIKAEISKSSFSFQKSVDNNRKNLIKAFENSPFVVENKKSNISVAWVRLPKGIISKDFCKWLEVKGVFTLPGNPFFWSEPKRGDDYFRVALARSANMFNKTVSKLVSECEEYLKSPTI